MVRQSQHRGSAVDKKHLHHKIWPYLLRDVVINRPNKV